MSLRFTCGPRIAFWSSLLTALVGTARGVNDGGFDLFKALAFALDSQRGKCFKKAFSLKALSQWGHFLRSSIADLILV